MFIISCLSFFAFSWRNDLIFFVFRFKYLDPNWFLVTLVFIFGISLRFICRKWQIFFTRIQLLIMKGSVLSERKIWIWKLFIYSLISLMPSFFKQFFNWDYLPLLVFFFIVQKILFIQIIPFWNSWLKRHKIMSIA